MDLEHVVAEVAPAIDPSTYLNYDVLRRRGTGPDLPSPAWVEPDGTVAAIVYQDELEGLSPEARGRFYSTRAPSVAIAVRAIPGAIEPYDPATSRVRFRFETGHDPVPPAGEVGRVKLIDRGRELPLIPYSAILNGPEGPYVMVASPDGRTLGKRPVEIGKIFGGLAVVLSGVGPRERVLTRSAFFVDAERRLRQSPAIEVRR